MLTMLRSSLARIHNHVGGWMTRRKIVVIESDDWGAIRMPSREAYEHLLRAGFDVDRCPYARNDTLETAEDLDALYEVLDSVRDAHARPAVITANTVVANPDFDRIRAADFKSYFYESFLDTYRRYPGREGVFERIQEGQRRGLYYPQYHGREHVQSRLWLAELRKADAPLRRAFDVGTWAAGPSVSRSGTINLQAALDTDQHAEIEQQGKALSEGLDLFASIFGFPAESFIANNFIYHSDLNRVLRDKGVWVIQGMKYQKHPILDGHRRAHIRHRQGEINHLGQMYVVRNATFEPAQKPANYDSVAACLRDVASAFFWNRPAVITMHRLNVMGGLQLGNRSRNLEMLSSVLKQIVRRWPMVEFMTSVELAQCMMPADRAIVNDDV